MRLSLLLLASLPMTPVSLVGQILPSGSVHYVINYQGQPAGSASYAIQAGPGGYSISAHGNARIGDINLAFSKDETLDAKMEILAESLSGTINGQAVFVTVRPEDAKFQVETSANGQRLSNNVDRHPHTVFAPNFDPSSILLFLRQAANQSPDQAGNHKDLWALVPQQSGLLVPASVTPQKDENGTLNGSTIAVRHSTLTVANVNSDVYSTPSGELLQEEVPTQGFSMMRDGFILTPPKTAAQPPQPPPAPVPANSAPTGLTPPPP